MKRFRLGEIVSHLAHGGTPPTGDPSLWTGKIPWITGADILNQKVGDIRRHINEKAVRTTATNIVSEGDLLLVTRTGVGKMAIAPFDIAISQDFTGLTFDDQVADTNYMYFLLQAKTDDLLAFNQGTSINGITRSDLLNLEVDLPQKSEQTAIADILATVDRAIAQTEALIAKQRRIKAGLMHDLLTRGIDEAGNLRHPSTHRFTESAVGLVPVEWEVKKLSDYGTVLGGKRLPAGHSYTANSTGYRYLRVLDFYGKTISFAKLVNLEETTFKALAKYEICDGDLFISIAGSIGYCGVLRIPGADRIILTENAAKIRLSTEFVPEFLAMQMNGHQVQQQIVEAKGTGGGVPKLALFRIENLRIARPSISEQNEIVKNYVVVESMLNDYAAELSKLHRLKTGLMQDLLTGRVSVEELLENQQHLGEKTAFQQ